MKKGGKEKLIEAILNPNEYKSVIFMEDKQCIFETVLKKM